MMERKINVKLKTVLVEKDLSQRRLARLAGIPEQLISMIIRGQYVPSPIQIAKISEILEVAPRRIFH